MNDEVREEKLGDLNLDILTIVHNCLNQAAQLASVLATTGQIP